MEEFKKEFEGKLQIEPQMMTNITEVNDLTQTMTIQQSLLSSSVDFSLTRFMNNKLKNIVDNNPNLI